MSETRGRITIDRQGDVVVLAGAIDEAARLGDLLGLARGADLVLDLAGVTFINSLGCSCSRWSRRWWSRDAKKRRDGWSWRRVETRRRAWSKCARTTLPRPAGGVNPQSQNRRCQDL